MRTSLLCLSASLLLHTAAHAQSSGRDLLDKLKNAPRPAQQTDLDTLQLASAHREKARSMEEKTNGLWQSWLVSVCQGCGPDQKPAQPIEQWPQRSVNLQHGAGEAPAQRRAPEQRGPQHSLVSDLSPENISSIRRMPAQ